MESQNLTVSDDDDDDDDADDDVVEFGSEKSDAINGAIRVTKQTITCQ